MTKFLFFVFTISSSVIAHKPLHFEQAKKLEDIMSFGKDYVVRKEAQHEQFLLESLANNNDLLAATSLHYLFKGGYKDVDNTFIAGKPISEAVYFIENSSQSIDNFSSKDKELFWKKSLNNSNPYIRLESAFKLVELDSSLALASFEKLEKEGSIVSATANSYRRKLSHLLSMKIPLPIPENHSSYQQLLVTTERYSIANSSLSSDKVDKFIKESVPSPKERMVFNDRKFLGKENKEGGTLDSQERPKNKRNSFIWLFGIGITLVIVIVWRMWTR